MNILPKSRPAATRDRVESILYGGWNASNGKFLKVPEGSAAILNVRGYYLDTMGIPRVNDAGIYDDACFFLTPTRFLSFNANTDPSVIGWNRQLGKPYAMLDEGIWPFIKGYHKGQYQALRQPDPDQAKRLGIPNQGFFTVIRDDGKGHRYLDEGYHAINYHKGSANGTSSWGCQTIPPQQYSEWQKTIYGIMTAHKLTFINCMLINGPIN